MYKTYLKLNAFNMKMRSYLKFDTLILKRHTVGTIY